jgi:hypothetical protein
VQWAAETGGQHKNPSADVTRERKCVGRIGVHDNDRTGLLLEKVTKSIA